ncbi:MAG: hypothetical protein ACREJ2_05770 [Planctomycetota bacterium]
MAEATTSKGDPQVAYKFFNSLVNVCCDLIAHGKTDAAKQVEAWFHKNWKKFPLENALDHLPDELTAVIAEATRPYDDSDSKHFARRIDRHASGWNFQLAAINDAVNHFAMRMMERGGKLTEVMAFVQEFDRIWQLFPLWPTWEVKPKVILGHLAYYHGTPEFAFQTLESILYKVQQDPFMGRIILSRTIDCCWQMQDWENLYRMCSRLRHYPKSDFFEDPIVIERHINFAIVACLGAILAGYRKDFDEVSGFIAKTLELDPPSPTGDVKLWVRECLEKLRGRKFPQARYNNVNTFIESIAKI